MRQLNGLGTSLRSLKIKFRILNLKEGFFLFDKIKDKKKCVRSIILIFGIGISTKFIDLLLRFLLLLNSIIFFGPKIVMEKSSANSLIMFVSDQEITYCGCKITIPISFI